MNIGRFKASSWVLTVEWKKDGCRWFFLKIGVYAPPPLLGKILDPPLLKKLDARVVKWLSVPQWTRDILQSISSPTCTDLVFSSNQKTLLAKNRKIMNNYHQWCAKSKCKQIKLLFCVIVRTYMISTTPIRGIFRQQLQFNYWHTHIICRKYESKIIRKYMFAGWKFELAQVY